MSAGGAPPPAQPNVRSRFWSYSPPGRIGSGSWATTGPATRIDGGDRHGQGADPPRTGVRADHGCTSSVSMTSAAGSSRRTVVGSGARPTLSSEHGATWPVDAGARRRPIADGLEARRRGDVGRDARPHVERCQVPVALEHERSAADGRGPGARDDRLAGTRRGVDGRHAAREPGADVVGDHARLRDADDRSGAARRDHASRRRVDDPRATRDLAARRDRQPPVRCPPQVRRERPPVTRVRREAGQEPDRRSAAGRAAPHAQVRAGRPVDPVLERRAEVRVEDGAADDRRLHRDRRCAAAGRIDARAAGTVEPSSSPTRTTPSHGTRGERLRGQREQPGASADHPEREPLARQRARGIEHGVHPEPGHAARGWSRGDRRPARRRIPRWVRRLEHGRPGDAGRPQQRDRGQGHERTRESKHLHEGLLRRDIRREEGEAASVVMGTYAPLTGVRARWYPRGINRGPRAPAHPTRRVAKPVRVRHSPATVTAPSGAEVRSPIRRRRSSLREKGQAHRAIHRLTPPSIPKRGVRRFLFLPASGVPVDARSRATVRRRRHPVPRPAAAPAGRGPRRLLVAGRQRQPDRRRARVPVARRDADVATDARADGLADRGARLAAHPHGRRGDRGHDPGRADEDRLDHQRGDRDPVRARRRRPGRRQGRGVQPVSAPRSPTSPTSPSSARSTSRRSWPRARTS